MTSWFVFNKYRLLLQELSDGEYAIPQAVNAPIPPSENISPIQVFAATESIIADCCYAVANSYRCQAFAGKESTIAYICYAIGNSYRCQAFATIESIIAYVCYAVANSY